MTQTIKLQNFKIGRNEAPFIIAEVGINHNGELSRAIEMIRVAKESGVSCVKFQTFQADEFVGDRSQEFSYKSQGKTVTEPMYDMFKRYELKKEDWVEIKKECERQSIMFMSTPQNRSDLDLLLSVGVEAIKIGSDDFTNIPLLKSYAETKLPIILSCGMANEEEIEYSLKSIGVFEGYPIVLLLCTSQYPTPPEDVNILKLKTLHEKYPQLLFGFSDHTQGPTAATLAVGQGACVFEKHFTLSHDLPGPDHWFSENPEGLREWATAIKTAHKMMGSADLQPTAAEEKMKVLARRSVVALQDIRAGDQMTAQNIGLRRPGNGLPPSQFESVLGQKALRDIKKESLIQRGDFE